MSVTASRRHSCTSVQRLCPPPSLKGQKGRKPSKALNLSSYSSSVKRGVIHPSGTRLSSSGVLSGGAVLQRHTLIGGTLWQITFTDRITHGYCSLFYPGANGWKKHFSPARPPLLCHRRTAPVGTEITLNLHRGT